MNNNLKEDYLNLLDAKHKEQVYQDFIEINTKLIPRDFVQNHGVSCSIVLRKLSFGSDFKSDFFYLTKSSDDWNAVFVEIEKPHSKFFKDNSNEFHGDFNRALAQINQWRAWLTPDNQKSFLSGLSAIQVPAHMAQNPTYNKFILVYGRRAEYNSNNMKRALVRALEREDFKIISFDSLAEDLESKYPLSIGVRHNDHIDIITDEIPNPGMFSCIDPSQFMVSKTLHDKMKNSPPGMHKVIVDGKLEDAINNAAKSIRVKS